MEELIDQFYRLQYLYYLFSKNLSFNEVINTGVIDEMRSVLEKPLRVRRLPKIDLPTIKRFKRVDAGKFLEGVGEVPRTNKDILRIIYLLFSFYVDGPINEKEILYSILGEYNDYSNVVPILIEYLQGFNYNEDLFTRHAVPKIDFELFINEYYLALDELERLAREVEERGLEIDNPNYEEVVEQLVNGEIMDDPFNTLKRVMRNTKEIL